METVVHKCLTMEELRSMTLEQFQKAGSQSLLCPDCQTLVQRVQLTEIVDKGADARLAKMTFGSGSVEDRARAVEALKTLSFREREIVRLRLGTKYHSLEKTGKLFKVTRERVRQLEAKIIGKVRCSKT